LENREITQLYYNNVLKLEGEAPHECTPEICAQIIDQHLSSSSQWAIIPWQDWMSIDADLRRSNPDEERINVPSNSDQYWQYRMHLSIEKLLRKTRLNERIKGMGRK
jgi:4-alpha-glucanotransferase